MESIKKILYAIFLIYAICTAVACSQTIRQIPITEDPGLNTSGLVMSDSSIIRFTAERPLYSIMLNGKYLSSSDLATTFVDGQYSQITENMLSVTYSLPAQVPGRWTGDFVFKNTGQDTLILSNFVPFGEDRKSIYITGYGDPGLARACLFRPGFRPVRAY